MKECTECHEEFKPTRSSNLTCSKICARIRDKRLRPVTLRLTGLATSVQVGVMHEHVVMVDLLRRGLQPYKSISPDAPVDLAVLCGSRLIRVEVTTGYRTKQGVNPRNIKLEKAHGWDVLAMVEIDGKITYTPPIDQVLAGYTD